MTTTSTAPPISYGKACLQCRQKKRKCQPLRQGQCVQCEKDEEQCRFSQFVHYFLPLT